MINRTFVRLVNIRLWRAYRRKWRHSPSTPVPGDFELF